MQQICYLLNIHQSLIPVYHPQAIPVEPKNRDLKPRLAILVQEKHDCWSEKLPFIRFCSQHSQMRNDRTDGSLSEFLVEIYALQVKLLMISESSSRTIIFVPEITPYLKKFAKFFTQIREVVQEQQDNWKLYADKREKLLQHINLENMYL
ncbi:integrase catalytic domain-containing protein [Trichonephila clavipes]|nr:integrase catalytic domain-containing protein [Trichonephila clavipes]